MRVCSLILVALISSLSAFAQSGGTTADCGSCHRAKAISQPLTQMGQAMQLPEQDKILRTHPKLTFHRGGYFYTVETRNGSTQYIVSDGSRSIRLPVLWSMGAQAQTWVLERGGRLYESLVSYYPATDRLDVTAGDDDIHPASLEEAIGKPLDNQRVTACLSCHATNAVLNSKLNLASLHPGVGCEHCHTGAMEHNDAMLRGDTTILPPDLSSLSSEEISDFCGRCHRTWELVVRSHWRGPSNVRFQPYRLALSKCYNGSDPRISCIACHDPHVSVVRDVSYYDSKCLACHSAKATLPHSHAKVCPVARSKCASCHMPKVPIANGHLVFTDHDIRIVKPGEPYPY